MNVRLSADVAQFIASMNAAAASTKAVTTSGRDLNKLGSQFSSAGRMLTMGLTAPITAAGVASVGMSNKFSTSFTRMTTLAGISTSEIGKLRQSVLNLSGATGRGPQELADALYNASSSGLDAAQSMAAVEIAAKGAAAGLGGTEDIISLVASATASYGSEAMNASKATDILVGTIREGRADPDELAGSLGRILPVASNLGVTFEEVGGSVAFLSNVMGDTNRSVTSMGGVLQKLSSPTDQAREALNQYGSSMETLHGIIAEDGILGAMQHLQAIGLSDDPLAFRAVFDDVEARQGAQAMIDNLDALGGAIDGVKGSAGSLDEAFAAAQGESGFKMAQAWAEIQVALIEFGDAIGPIAANVAGGVADIVSAFSSLPEGVQMAITAALIAVGPMAMIAGTIMKHAQSIKAAMDVIKASRFGPAVGAGGLVAGVGAAVGVGGWLAYQGIDALMGGGLTDYDEAVQRQRDILAGIAEAEGELTATALEIRAARERRAEILFGTGDIPAGNVGGWEDPVSGSTWDTKLGTSGLSFDGPAPPRLRPPTAPAAAPLPARPVVENVTMDMASSMLAGVQSAAGGASMTTAAIAKVREETERLVAATQGYAAVTATMDWGAAGFAGAQAGMSRFTADQFGLINIAMASEEAFDRLNSSVEENGFTFDVTTAKGRENMGALQGLAQTLDTQFVSAYDNANGSMAEFMWNATVLGNETLARLQTELGLTDDETKELATTLGLTATDYEARFNLAGDEEAKIRLGLLSGVIGLLQEDVQREVAMKIATGDFQGALDLVQTNIAETPTEHSTTIKAIDNASQTIRTIRGLIDGVRSKTVTITVRRQGGSAAGNTYDYGGGDVALSMGGVFDRATRATIGEAGLEVALPLTKPDRLAALLSDPRVFTPISAAMGYAGGSSSGSSSAGSVSTTLDTAGIEAAVERGAYKGAYRGAASSTKELSSAIRGGTRF